MDGKFQWKIWRGGVVCPWVLRIVLRVLCRVLAESAFPAPRFFFTSARGGGAGGGRPQVGLSRAIAANVAKNVLSCPPQASRRNATRRDERTTWHGNSMKRW